MGLPMENDLLATTSEEIIWPESKFGTQKNLLLLTFQSINIVHRSRDMSQDHFSKNLKIDKTGGGKKSTSIIFFIHINKFLSLHVWNYSPLHFAKKKN